MSENVRIAVRDSLDRQTLTFLDNSAVGALHYTNDTLNRVFEGKGEAGAIVFDVPKTHDDVQHLVCGNKLAFVRKDKDYWLNIIDVEENEYQLTVIAFSLSLELNNETRGEYNSDGALSIEQYIRAFDPERTLTIGLNEVSDKRISYEWTGTQTVLARLYSVANVFSAEFEFVTKLNDDYSLNSITLNIYREHSDTSQGIGENKTNVTLRLGKEINTVTRKENIKEIYTAIRPRGKDGLNLVGFVKNEYDANGLLEYYTNAPNDLIWAPQARDRFPSFISKASDNYITYDWETEYSTQEALYGAALAELKKHSVPELEFEVDGYFDTNVGDTLTIENAKYKPTLIIEARVTEQVESFTDPSKNKTTFSNFKEIGSQIDSTLLAKVQQLIDANKKFDYDIVSSNGIVFKNGQGQTTLTARVMDGVEDVTDSYFITWFKDGVHLTDIKALPVSASDITERALYRFEATNSQGTVVGGAETTVSNVYDGQPGDDGVGIAESVIDYAISESGTESPEEGWQTDVPAVPVGQFLWTRTIQTFTDETQTIAFSVSKIGSDGKEGEKGDSGIIYQEEEPDPKTLNMLWQKPGEPLKRWNGSVWVIHQLFIDNIYGDNLTVNDGKFVSLEGASIINPFDIISQGAQIVGTTTIEDAKIRMDYTVPIASQTGFLEINPQSIISTIYDSNGDIVSMVSLDSTGLLLRQGGVTSSLSAQNMYDTGWVTLPWSVTGTSGSLQYRYYLGTFTLRFVNFVYNGTNSSGSPLAQIPSSVFVPTSAQMHLIPLWTTAGTTDTIQVNADGGIYKVTNNAGTTMARASFVVF